MRPAAQARAARRAPAWAPMNAGAIESAATSATRTVICFLITRC